MEFFWHPEDHSHPETFFIVAALWGMAHSIVNTALNSDTSFISKISSVFNFILKINYSFSSLWSALRLQQRGRFLKFPTVEIVGIGHRFSLLHLPLCSNQSVHLDGSLGCRNGFLFRHRSPRVETENGKEESVESTHYHWRAR